MADLCKVCDANPAKYRCPSCRIPYCSVPCCKSHKQSCAPPAPKASTPPLPPPPQPDQQPPKRRRTDPVLPSLSKEDLVATTRDLLAQHPHLKTQLSDILKATQRPTGRESYTPTRGRGRGGSRGHAAPQRKQWGDKAAVQLIRRMDAEPETQTNRGFKLFALRVLSGDAEAGS